MELAEKQNLNPLNPVKRHRILIVDDDETIRELLAQFFELEGYETQTASNGKLAFEKAVAARPDLVITDIRMPVWDGFEMAKNLWTLEPPLVPVIFISGYAEGDELKELRGNPNMIAFFPKPLSAAMLIDKVNEFLR